MNLKKQNNKMKKIIFLSSIASMFILVGCGASKTAEYDKFLERLITIAPGNICENGGTATLHGTDLNQNNQLDDFEILNSKSTYACKGDQGERGPMGPMGPTGADGTSCTLSYTVPFSPTDKELVDESTCKNGGIVNTFVCTDGMTYNTYSCTGETGATGLQTLSTQSIEPPGTNCPFGGYKIDSGADLNQNSILETNEITNTDYICN